MTNILDLQSLPIADVSSDEICITTLSIITVTTLAH
jgi:hypothetical protein